MLRSIIILALALGSIFGRAQNAAANALSFKSPTGEWELIFESKATGVAGALLVNVTAAMVDRRDAIPKSAWIRNFGANDADFIKTLQFEPIIAPDADCFLIKRVPTAEQREYVLVGPKFDKVITKVNRQAPSYFESEESRLFEFDQIVGKPVVAVWDREAESWSAFSTADGAEIPITANLTKRWNEMIRSKILAKIEKQRARLLARKLDAVAEKLADFAVKAVPLADPLRPLDFEFLALLRDPRDQPFFQRLIDMRELDSGLLSGIPRDTYFFTWGRAGSGDGLTFQKTDYELLLADHLLTVFEGKAKPKTGSFRGRDRYLSSSSRDHMDREERHHLGEVEGKIQLPTPLKNPLGTFRIYLTPDKSQGWESRRETLVIEQTLNSPPELQDTVRFLFSTVNPGKYFAKAIWDRRAPFTDKNAAGPGDYESGFVGPLDVTAGAKTTNVMVSCTIHALGGEEYYRADQTASKLAENMELTPRGLNGAEKFNAAAEKWIVNMDSPKRRAWINSVALVKGGRVQTFESDWPDALIVYARQRSSAATNELHRLEIRDQHGCAFKTGQTGSEPTEEYFFPDFPRADDTWRLVGFGNQDEELLDLTLTNLVKSPQREVADARPLPIEVDLGAVRMRVKGAQPSSGWGKVYAKLNLEFIDAKYGTISTNWFVMDCRFVDRHGNQMNPADFCREENAARVIGRALNRDTVKRESGKDRIERMMRGPNLKSAIPFEFVMPRVSVGPLVE